MPMKHHIITSEWQKIGTAPLTIQVKKGRVRIYAGTETPQQDTKDYVLASDERDGYPRSPKFSKAEDIYIRSDLAEYTAELVVVS